MKSSVFTARALPALLLLLPLYGCAGSKIAMGEVYDKQHEPENTSLLMIPIVTSDGNMSMTTMIPMVVCDDEDWIVCIRQWNEEEQRFDTNRLFVTPEIYGQVALGDWFSRDTDCCEEKDPHEKRRE